LQNQQGAGSATITGSSGSYRVDFGQGIVYQQIQTCIDLTGKYNDNSGQEVEFTQSQCRGFTSGGASFQYLVSGSILQNQQGANQLFFNTGYSAGSATITGSSGWYRVDFGHGTIYTQQRSGCPEYCANPTSEPRRIACLDAGCLPAMAELAQAELIEEGFEVPSTVLATAPATG